MIIIIGLGNIGVQYANTYHNLGFKAIDKLSAMFNISVEKKKYKSLIGKGTVKGQEIILAKPITYMNNSGMAVYALKKKYRDSRIIVIVDDIDLKKGEVRYRERGKRVEGISGAAY